MSANVPIKFTIGETLSITGEIRRVHGIPLDISSAVVVFRAQIGATQFDKVATITDGPEGLYELTVGPDEQTGFVDGKHQYEIRASFLDGTVKSVNAGTLTILPTLF